MSLPGLFVVGTDTGVGKTVVAAGLARAMTREGKRVGVLKPVATGAKLEGGVWLSEDAEKLIEAVGGGVSHDRVAPLVFEEPLAPPVAARRSGTKLRQETVEERVSEALDWWSDRADVMVVEGVGGLLCPLAEETTVADLALALDYPLVVVARRRLGTLNHTLLTVEAAQRRNLRLAGLVINSPEPESFDAAEASCTEELSRRLPEVAILAEVPHENGRVAMDELSLLNWFPRARPPRFPSLGRS
jgi:dethiobiotin synthetase